MNPPVGGTGDPRVGHHGPMPAGGTVADELERVADTLRAVDEALLGAHRLLAGAASDGVAPGSAGDTLGEVLSTLDTRLGETAEECADGARSVRARAGDSS